jgi:branched-chain amino acid transport system permease protein
MTSDIALFLAQDGVVNASIYALIGLALVLVFIVTRILFVPQGEFVSYSALTLASFATGATPATLWIMLGGAVAATGLTMWRDWKRVGRLEIRPTKFVFAAYLAAVVALTLWLAPTKPPAWIAIALTIAIVAPLGPSLYTLMFEGIASAGNLTLLIAAVALHYALVGVGLILFGAEGSRAQPFIDANFSLGPLLITSQSILVVTVTALVMVALFAFFSKSIHGKALRATAISRAGAKLVGIRPGVAGRISFLFASLLGAISGVLIAPVTTVYYDSGFLVGLKGFVAAIIAGLASYPIAVGGALAVGMLESFSSFWFSAYKEVIVFTLIIPVLLWRSLRSPHIDEK